MVFITSDLSIKVEIVQHRGKMNVMAIRCHSNTFLRFYIENAVLLAKWMRVGLDRNIGTDV